MGELGEKDGWKAFLEALEKGKNRIEEEIREKLPAKLMRVEKEYGVKVFRRILGAIRKIKGETNSNGLIYLPPDNVCTEVLLEIGFLREIGRHRQDGEVKAIITSMTRLGEVATDLDYQGREEEMTAEWLTAAVLEVAPLH